jgi:hypothetical protein
LSWLKKSCGASWPARFFLLRVYFSAFHCPVFMRLSLRKRKSNQFAKRGRTDKDDALAAPAFGTADSGTYRWFIDINEERL